MISTVIIISTFSLACLRHTRSLPGEYLVLGPEVVVETGRAAIRYLHQLIAFETSR